MTLSKFSSMLASVLSVFVSSHSSKSTDVENAEVPKQDIDRWKIFKENDRSSIDARPVEEQIIYWEMEFDRLSWNREDPDGSTGGEYSRIIDRIRTLREENPDFQVPGFSFTILVSERDMP